MQKFIVVMGFLLACTTQASALTIDFEDASGPYDTNWNGFQYSISNQGVDILAQGFSVGDGPEQPSFLSPGSFGSKSLYIESSGFSQDGFSPKVDISISKADGSAFALLSMDYLIGELGNGGFSGLIGNTSDGGTVSTDTAFGTGGWLDIESVYIFSDGDGFFSVGTASIEVDNIVMGAAVPVPAAVWLFGSALGALGWMRRKKLA